MDRLTKYGLKIFTEKMCVILEKNYERKKDTWLTCDIGFLQRKLKEEVNEYFSAKSDIHRMQELIDISNICLFLFIKCIFTSMDARFNEFLKDGTNNA